MTGATWTDGALDNLDRAVELEISAPRPDGSHGRRVPIWVVTAQRNVFVRTWKRRTDGWYGHAVESGRARIRLSAAEVDVSVEDVGDHDAALRAAVDQAYRDKYGPYGGSTERMVGAEAASTTLRLAPIDSAGDVG